MQPPAHRPYSPIPQQIERTRRYHEDYDLFFANLDLVLQHERTILSNDSYFFCRPEFATYGVYFNSPLTLGALLLGWRHGLLREHCCVLTEKGQDSPNRYGSGLVYFFGGMGSGVWRRAYCPACGKTKRFDGNHLLWERMYFCQSAREQFKDWTEVLDIEHYSSYRFSFAKPALVPCFEGRIRKVRQNLIQAATVIELIEELKTGNVRPPTAKDRTLLQDELVVTSDGVETERITLVG